MFWRREWVFQKFRNINEAIIELQNLFIARLLILMKGDVRDVG